MELQSEERRFQLGNGVSFAYRKRLFLGGFDLTPTYKDVCNKFSVSYILNLVLVDEDDRQKLQYFVLNFPRRYFKQKEIFLWRKQDKPRLVITNKDGTTVEEPQEHTPTFVEGPTEGKQQ